MITPKSYTRPTTSLPKGKRASRAILKCCLPNGMPMTVMQSRSPMNTWPMNAQIPTKTSHSKPASMVRQPPAPALSLTSDPNGQMHSIPSLKHCSPNGIPTMVQHHTTPAAKYDSAASSPPKTNHNILPIMLMGVKIRTCRVVCKGRERILVLDIECGLGYCARKMVADIAPVQRHS